MPRYRSRAEPWDALSDATVGSAGHSAIPRHGTLGSRGDVYTYTGFTSVIGNTDIAGDARYERRQPRPLLRQR